MFNLNIQIFFVIAITTTAQKMKFSIKDFFSKCDQIRTFTEEIFNKKLRFLCIAIVTCRILANIITFPASFWILFQASIYLLKANNRNTRTTCKICSKLTIKTPERWHWGVANFKQLNIGWVSCLIWGLKFSIKYDFDVSKKLKA